MNNCKKYYTWLIALTAAAFIITAVCIQFMADSVPMHYNFHGEIDRYGSRNENFIFPCFIALFNIFWVIFMNVFGRRADRAQEEKVRVEAAGNLKVLGFTAIGTTIMFIIIQFAMLLVDINASEGQDRMPIDINVISNCCLGLIFIVIGNIIPKCKRKSVVGVRTSWSMDNDTTWELSNRLGGRLIMICGVLTIIETIIVKGFASTVIMLVLIIAMSALMIYYSYVFYKKYGNNAKKHQ